jgi:hypothetical protein
MKFSFYRDFSLAVGFVSSFSRFDNLAKLVPALEVLQRIPLGSLIAGLLPTILVAVLVALVPSILRFLSVFSGSPLISATEREVHTQYFTFQVFNVLIAVTVTGSLISSLRAIIDQPAKALDLLSSKIPSYSTFFINYVMLLGLVSELPLVLISHERTALIFIIFLVVF